MAVTGTHTFATGMSTGYARGGSVRRRKGRGIKFKAPKTGFKPQQQQPQQPDDTEDTAPPSPQTATPIGGAPPSAAPVAAPPVSAAVPATSPDEAAAPADQSNQEDQTGYCRGGSVRKYQGGGEVADLSNLQGIVDASRMVDPKAFAQNIAQSPRSQNVEDYRGGSPGTGWVERAGQLLNPVPLVSNVYKTATGDRYDPNSLQGEAGYGDIPARDWAGITGGFIHPAGYARGGPVTRQSRFTLTPDQFKAFLIGHGSQYDHVAHNGIEKNLHIASRAGRDQQPRGYQWGGEVTGDSQTPDYSGAPYAQDQGDQQEPPPERSAWRRVIDWAHQRLQDAGVTGAEGGPPARTGEEPDTAVRPPDYEWLSRRMGGTGAEGGPAPVTGYEPRQAVTGGLGAGYGALSQSIPGLTSPASTGYDEAGFSNVGDYLSGKGGLPSEEMQRRERETSAANPDLSRSGVTAKMLEDIVNTGDVGLGHAMSQALREHYDDTIAKAQGAAHHGDVVGSANLTNAAMELLPDGKETKFTPQPDGNVGVTVSDATQAAARDPAAAAVAARQTAPVGYSPVQPQIPTGPGTIQTKTPSGVPLGIPLVRDQAGNVVGARPTEGGPAQRVVPYEPPVPRGPTREQQDEAWRQTQQDYADMRAGRKQFDPEYVDWLTGHWQSRGSAGTSLTRDPVTGEWVKDKLQDTARSIQARNAAYKEPQFATPRTEQEAADLEMQMAKRGYSADQYRAALRQAGVPTQTNIPYQPANIGYGAQTPAERQADIQAATSTRAPGLYTTAGQPITDRAAYAGYADQQAAARQAAVPRQIAPPRAPDAYIRPTVTNYDAKGVPHTMANPAYTAAVNAEKERYQAEKRAAAGAGGGRGTGTASETAFLNTYNQHVKAQQEAMNKGLENPEQYGPTAEMKQIRDRIIKAQIDRMGGAQQGPAGIPGVAGAAGPAPRGEAPATPRTAGSPGGMIPPQAAAALRANPQLRAQFDAKYGPNASSLVLGQ